MRCRDCGFIFTSPRFSGSDYDRIYRLSGHPANLDPSFEAAKAAAVQSTVRYCPQISARMRCRSSISAVVTAGFLRQFDSPAGRGFEIGAEGRRRAGPCEVVTGDWAKIAGSPIFPPAAFDFVVAFDVLEHLPRIEEDVALIRTVLKSRGMFFASVPNIESFVAKAMGKRWNMLLLEHLWYFSPKTLERIDGASSGSNCSLPNHFRSMRRSRTLRPGSRRPSA